MPLKYKIKASHPELHNFVYAAWELCKRRHHGALKQTKDTRQRSVYKCSRCGATVILGFGELGKLSNLVSICFDKQWCDDMITEKKCRR